MIKASYDGKAITDSLKRTIILRKPTIMDRYNLNKCMKQDADILSCMNMMSAIIYVAKVNERVYESPRSYEECLALLQNLGEEGIEAVYSELLIEVKEEPENIKK
jgi:hypothetical protein